MNLLNLFFNLADQIEKRIREIRQKEGESAFKFFLSCKATKNARQKKERTAPQLRGN